MTALATIQFADYAHYLKPRPNNWHKGLSGHVLVIGGDLGFGGAPQMAAAAALRVGAGLVTIATRVENAGINPVFPEIMQKGIAHSQELLPYLERADVIVLGPGLGQSEWSYALWQVALQQNKSIILDADGLNLLAIHPQMNANWILTPHPGEAARLLQTGAENIQTDRIQAVKNLEQRYQGVVVLKGSGTLVCHENNVCICLQGNPGMATAGMGDMLSGVLGGLVAQHIPLVDAAKLGVYLHAAAGDLAAKSGERGIIATDLLTHLHTLCNP